MQHRRDLQRQDEARAERGPLPDLSQTPLPSCMQLQCWAAEQCRATADPLSNTQHGKQQVNPLPALRAMSQISLRSATELPREPLARSASSTAGATASRCSFQFMMAALMATRAGRHTPSEDHDSMQSIMALGAPVPGPRSARAWSRRR